MKIAAVKTGILRAVLRRQAAGAASGAFGAQDFRRRDRDPCVFCEPATRRARVVSGDFDDDDDDDDNDETHTHTSHRVYGSGGLR